MKRIATRLIALALVILPPAAAAQPSVRDRLTELAERLVAATVTEDPIVASSLGLERRRQPARDSERGCARGDDRRLNGWKEELEAIARSAGGGLGLVDGNNVRLLRAEFDSQLNELVARQSDRKNYARPALRLVQAIFSQFLHLPIVGRESRRPGRSRQGLGRPGVATGAGAGVHRRRADARDRSPAGCRARSARSSSPASPTSFAAP